MTYDTDGGEDGEQSEEEEEEEEQSEDDDLSRQSYTLDIVNTGLDEDLELDLDWLEEEI